jgi:signal transduction histidine kinase
MSQHNELRLPWRRARKVPPELHDFVVALASRTLAILEPRERVTFMESEIRGAFRFRRVDVLVRPERSERFSSESMRVRDLLSRIGGYLQGWKKPFLNEAVARDIGASTILTDTGATYVFPVGSVPGWIGLLLIDSSPVKQLDPAIESLLTSMCRQIAVVLDNSTLLRAKLELERTLSLQAQMVQLGEMTARIAHEIKNPLSSIKTIVQVMQEAPELQARYATELALIRGEVDRLASSVVQLLNFARPVPDGQEAVDLRDIVEAVLAFLRHDIEQNGISVDDSIPERLPAVLGGASTFKEIFLNLMLNAIQAGGAGMRVTIRAGEVVLEDDSERFVLLTFEDDGPGVSPEVKEKMFAPFFTTRQRGTGLGLAIVKRNVEHLGGDISVESPAQVGRGTRFVIHFPVAE